MSTTNLDQFIDNQITARPIEARLIRKIVKALADAGTPIISAWDGEETTPITNLRDVMVTAFNLDEVRLETTDSWVFLVMGEGWDMLSDYGVSLETALAPVNAYITKNW